MARIATIEEFAPYAGIKNLATADQDLVQATIDAAESLTERWLNRTLSPLPAFVAGVDSASPVTKKYNVRGGGRRVRVPDLRTIVSATLDGLALTTNWDYYLDGTDVEPAVYFKFDSLPKIARGSAGVLSLTGRWGFNPPPPEAKDAICRHAGRMWARRDARYSDQIVTPDGAQYVWQNALQDDVRMVYESYRVVRFAIA